MLSRVALVRTDVSGELSASIFRLTRIGELGTTLAVISNRSTLRRNAMYAISSQLIQLLVTANVPSSHILVTLMMETIRSSETSVLTRATRRDIPEDGILQTFTCYWASRWPSASDVPRGVCDVQGVRCCRPRPARPRSCAFWRAEPRPSGGTVSRTQNLRTPKSTADLWPTAPTRYLSLFCIHLTGLVSKHYRQTNRIWNTFIIKCRHLVGYAAV
jgi:hypothetical protein